MAHELAGKIKIDAELRETIIREAEAEGNRNLAKMKDNMPPVEGEDGQYWMPIPLSIFMILQTTYWDKGTPCEALKQLYADRAAAIQRKKAKAEAAASPELRQNIKENL